MTTHNGTVWIWFQRIIGGHIWINGGDKLAVTKKKFFKKAKARKTTTVAKRPTISSIKMKFKPDFAKTLKERNSPYENNGFNFAACTPVENGKCEQLSGIFSCREGFLGSFRDLLYATNKKLSTRKTCIMIWVHGGEQKTVKKFDNAPYDKWMPDSVKASLKIINNFEKRNKWIRTRAYCVDHGYDAKHYVYVFEGSRWWITSPYTLSLYLLLIRLGRRTEVKKIAARASVDTIIKAIKSLPQGDDSGRVAAADKWLVLLDNRRKIFGERKTFESNFKATGGSNSEGIQKLTDNCSRDEVAQRKFNACLKDAGLPVTSRN